MHRVICFFIFLLRWLLHVSAKQCHPQGATMFLSEPLQCHYGRRQVIGPMMEPTYRHAIQGDSGGICNSLGNDSMCDSKQKSSYEHGSDFERLPRCGKKKIRTIRSKSNRCSCELFYL